MTVTITCPYTGLEFEAPTRRSKNHPKISAVLNEIATDRRAAPGAYGAAIEAIRNARTAGVSDIDEFVAVARAAAAGRLAEHRSQRDARIEAERKAEELRRERQRRNELFKANGYTWQKFAVGTDDEWAGRGSYYGGVGEFSHYEYELHSPDGRIVSEQQALDEIERGMEVVVAEKRQAEAARLAAEVTQAETEAYAEDAERTADAEYTASEYAARQAAKATGPEVEPFSLEGFTKAASGRHIHGSGFTRSFVLYTGRINGVECAAINLHSGGHDFNERTGFYCADPEAAGLARVEQPDPGSLDATFNFFFGI